MSRSKRLKYELIENASGRTLVSGSTSAEAMSNAAQYIADYNVSYNDVTYVVIGNGKKALAVFTATGDELRELLEDAIVVDIYELEDEDNEW